MSPRISTSTAASNAISIQSSKLAELEDIIRRGKETFFEVGNALAQIMEHQLYRQKGFGSFAEYTEQFWGFKKSYAYQLVQSAEVAKSLPESAMAENLNERQVRALISVPKEQRETVIKVAVTKAKSSGRKMTAKDIRDAAEPPLRGIDTTKLGDGQPEPITAEVVTMPDVEARPEPDFKRMFKVATHSEKSATRWWWTSAKPEKRGNFFWLLLTSGKPVHVEDKARFTELVMRWLADDVIEREEQP